MPPHGFGEGDAAGPTTILCSACQKINVANLMRKLVSVPDWWAQRNNMPKLDGMVHLVDARQLPLSATNCSMCRLILDAVLEENHHVDDLEHRLTDSPIYLRPSTPRRGTLPVFPGDEVAGASYVFGFRAFVPIQGGLVLGHIKLFALPDTPAALSCDVTGRPPLPSSDSPEAYNLIYGWISDCLAKHDVCRRTLSGISIDESFPPVLPTRIIHVGRPNEAICPRLVETNGETGHYVALSHCVEFAADSSLHMTTQTTLKNRLASIPCDTLPKAYQDAISVTHRLGLEYIWVDSLCIIQDSEIDCLYESSRKGTVFQSARLTIAASHATNSSESCFFPRPELPLSIELQHLSCTGQPRGTIFAISRPDVDNGHPQILPEFTPLASHAHATEEILLSRRIMFYTPANLVWCCKRTNQCETGTSFHSTCRNPSWRVVVEKHAARTCTKPSDRLAALEGVRVEISKKHKTGVYCFGLWQHQMPAHLLWYCLKPAQRAHSGINPPTWTWASTTCSVLFNKTELSSLTNECKGLRFDESSKTLTFGGVMKRLPRIVPFTDQPKWSNASLEEVLSPLHLLHRTPPGDQKRYILSEDGAVIGWALLDEPDTPSTGLRCIRITRKMLTKNNTKNAVHRRLYREWVLLVPGSEDDLGRFQRIGMGVITTLSPWFEDQATTQIHLG